VENIRFPHSPTPSHSPWKTRDRLIGSHRHDEFPTFPQAPLLQYSIIDDFFMLLFIAPLEQLHKELYTPRKMAATERGMPPRGRRLAAAG